MDSGAEVESPLSPDSFSSDSGSINALPGLTRTDLNCLTSKDSGLGKDNGLSDQGGSTATHDQGMATTERSLSTSELSVSGAKDAASASGIPTYSKVGYKSQENINAAGQGYSKLGIEYDQNNEIVNSVIVGTVPLPEKKEAMKKSEDPIL
ncbi:hypothetical protein CDAR_420511 [Caerostris darwini]|uniref:Uncharacterized protein n=1 Tax=Caerostris darwini TaxID=1538125 RepID=A0AAV4P0G4_9ARAC|nr:hypothetical protein CDAR_420511 [Caerostris darwini]